MALRAFSFVKVYGFLLEVLVENHIRKGVAEKERKRKRSEGDGKIKKVGVYLFCSLFSHPLSLFVLLKFFRV